MVVMTTVLLFHHAQGQTTGFFAFADALREAGHAVHAPDLYDGKTFGDLDEGVAYAKQVGFDEIICGGTATANELPAAMALVDEGGDAELFLYSGSSHLFADSSLDDFDAQAADLLKERTLAFLDRIG